MNTIVGIRPTGKLHIGHYFSVIKPALKYKADVLIADYHAPSQDGDILHGQLEDYGLCVIRQQDTFDPELYFSLLEATSIGILERMTQYKSTRRKTGHLLVYPVLMAHDLVGYDKVIVGDDQKQHVEFVNVLFKKVGIPKVKGDYRGGRIMDLNDPTKKMSKSNPKGCLFLGEDPTKKIMKAVTTKKGRENLIYLYKQLGGKKVPKLNKDLKIKLIELFKQVREEK